eukprot:s241_g17.t1
MGVMVPDPALILRGVDSLVDPLSRKASNAQVAFRLSVARNQLEIDHRPSMASVIEYMRVLQSEWEQVSVSGQEAASGQPKVARMETDQGNGGKDGDKGDKGGSMGVMVPDPALILRGVDSLVDPLSRKASNAQVAFRLSVARNQLEIDHRPSMASVIEYMRVLQSEWEQVEQRFRHTAQLLGYGTKQGLEPQNSVCSEGCVRDHIVSWCTVVLIPASDGEEARFHVAPVMYRNVKDQINFEAEEIIDETPPPAPAHRVTGKRAPLVAHVNVGGESGLGNESSGVESSECFVHQVPQEKEEIGESGETKKVRLCNLWGKLCVCVECVKKRVREMKRDVALVVECGRERATLWIKVRQQPLNCCADVT